MQTRSVILVVWIAYSTIYRAYSAVDKMSNDKNVTTHKTPTHIARIQSRQIPKCLPTTKSKTITPEAFSSYDVYTIKYTTSICFIVRA